MISRNPWTDINPWKEFRYDVRHPALFFKRSMAGIKGNLPEVAHVRLPATILLAVASAQFLVGIALVVRSYAG